MKILKTELLSSSKACCLFLDLCLHLELSSISLRARARAAAASRIRKLRCAAIICQGKGKEEERSFVQPSVHWRGALLVNGSTTYEFRYTQRLLIASRSSRLARRVQRVCATGFDLFSPQGENTYSGIYTCSVGQKILDNLRLLRRSSCLIR